MNIEYEATFANINKDEARKKLKNIGAHLVKSEFLMKRINFTPPPGVQGGWMRVRDEEERITLSYKKVEKHSHKISNQKEIELEINNFDKGCEMLKALGCKQKAYQETKRELWHYNNVEISIDTWPGLNPLLEIEGDNEKEVKEASEKLGFDWQEAIFDSIVAVYERDMGIMRKDMSLIPKLTFENPPKSRK